MPKKINVKKLFAVNLSHLRKEAGLSQNELAKKAGLTHNFVNDLENGKKGFSVITLGKLSEALEAEPYEFFINPDQWDNVEKQVYISVVNTLNKKVNRIFESYLNTYLNLNKGK